MEPNEQLRQILGVIGDLVERITVDDLAAPTPCTEFTVHDVLDHMMVLGGTFAAMYRGDEPAPSGAPPVYGRVPVAEFRAAMDDLLAAVTSDGAHERILATPLGELDGETFARVIAFDGLVHGWDLAVATGQRYGVDPAVVDAVDVFARTALTDDLRANEMFGAATAAPAGASPIEALAAFTGRTVDARWLSAPNAIRLAKEDVPVKIDVPGAIARQATEFGDATGYTTMAGEYFSLAAGTDIAPLLHGLDDDACHAPHWGYMIAGRVVVTFIDDSESTCSGGEIFYWPPGHTVRVVDDAEVILFSPQHEHVEVLDHMLGALAAA